MVDFHQRIQHPVGHGFFHSACIRFKDATFTYVYDCGGNSAPLKAEINELCADLVDGDKLDALFISHFHDDHVSGLDMLLSRVTAHTVILPYLDHAIAFVHLGEAMNEGGASRTYADFLTAPLEWLRDRGVRRVIMVRRRPDAPETPATLPEPTSPLSGEKGWRRLDIGQGTHSIQLDLANWQPKPSSPITTYEITDDRALRLITNTGEYLDWVLLPYAHPLAAAKAKNFAVAFRKVLKAVRASMGGKPSENSVIAQMLRSSKVRAEVAELYRLHAQGLNRSSLSLYSGPIEERFMERDAFPGGEGWSAGCGWLGTGDADLAVRKVFKAFHTHYKMVWDNISTLALPHHGSRHNFTPELLSASNLDLCYATANADSEKHPSPEVERHVRARRRLGWHVVTERAGDHLREILTKP